MKKLATLLLLTSGPMAGHADCLGSDLPPLGGILGNGHRLPARVDAQEQHRVESFLGTPVDHVVCAYATPGMRIDLDNGVIGSVSRGYLALTGESVIFIEAKRGSLIPRRNYEILFEAANADLTDITVPNDIGTNIIMDLGTSSTGALLEVPRGINGQAVVAELRARILDACSSAHMTPTEVRCP